MRDSCLQCALKHISESEILMREALMGYAVHSHLAVGHMAQAEAELIKDYPDMAHTIRAERINYMDGLKFKKLKDQDGSEYLDLNVEYEVDTVDLLKQLTILYVAAS